MTAVTLIVAADRRGVIGRDGGLPWHLPDELKRFKARTMGKPLVMGRRTWDSIGKPLPGRHNIVVTRQPGLQLDGATIVGSLEHAFAAAGEVPEVCIIGGAEIYRAALPVTSVLHVTRVHATFDVDTFFPPFEPGNWVESSREDRPADDRHAWPYSFVEWFRQPTT